MKACREGQFPMVIFLLLKGADVNQINDHDGGHTPLSFACAEGHIQIVNFLLSQGADPFHKLSDQSTMFIIAAKRNKINVVQQLLHHLSLLPDTRLIEPYLRSAIRDVIIF